MRHLPAILLNLAILGGTSLPGATPYIPYLPKASETEKVIVVDFGITKSKYEISKANDVLYTLTCLQGLANRNNPVKVVFDNMPVRIFWRPEGSDYGDGNGSAPGPGNPFEMMVKDGVFPWPMEKAVIDPAVKYPVLTWMLMNYGHLIKGKILVPNGEGASLGPKAAGLNACTFDSILPITPEVDRYIRSIGYEFPLLADLTDMDIIESQRWSVDRYADRPDVCKSVISFGTSPATMNDYWIVAKAFSYYLNKKDYPETEIIHDLVLRRKDGSLRWPQGVANIGNIEGPKAIQGNQARGYTAICGNVPNASVTSSALVNIEDFPSAPEAKIHSLKGNPVYISFHGNDGDAIDFCNYVSYQALHNDPMAGKVPVCFKVNPFFLDLNPLLVIAIGKKFRDTMDVTISMNDGGSSTTDAGRDGWIRQLRHYHEGSNHLFQSMNYFGPFETDRETTRRIETLDRMLYVYRAYQGFPGQKMALRIADNGYTVFSNMLGSGAASPEQLAEDIKTAIAEAGENGPQFYLGRLGLSGKTLNARRGTMQFSMAATVIRELMKDESIRDRLHFIPARDLAATYKSYRTIQSVNSPN